MAEEIVLNDQNVPRPPLQDELSRLYCQGSLTDITLTTEDGKNFEAHKVILAARSNYFYTIVPKLKSEAVIFLKGIKGAHLDKILKYIYSGSVAVSRHQLKPILDAAKCLQIKGIGDADPTEILSQQAQPSSSASAAAAVLASRFKQPETPPSISPMNARPSSQMNFFLPQQQPFFVNSMPALQNSGSASTSMRANSFSSKGFSPIKTGGVNGSTIFDSSDSDSPVEESKPKPEVVEVPVEKPKRKRGRPPKSAKVEKPAADPYDFDAENADQISKDDKLRRKNNDLKKLEKKEASENSEQLTSPATNGNALKDDQPRDGENKMLKSHMNTINGKKTLTVKCKNHIGELHISRFANGIRGRCIRYKEEWMTPVDFELACGSNGKKYLENIHTDFGPLRTLTASGMLKPHSKKCRCSICRRDMTPEKGELENFSKNKRPKKILMASEEDDGVSFKATNEDGRTEKRNGTATFEEKKLEYLSKFVETSDSDSDDSSELDFQCYNKKDMNLETKRRKKPSNSREDWRRQLTDQIRQQQQEHQFQQQHFQIGGFSFDQHDQSQHIQMSLSQDPLGLSGTPLGAIMMAPSHDHQQKLTHQVILSDRIEPPQHLQPPTFYVMSPHPSMSTPHHNPFGSITPAPTPAPPMTPHLTHMSPPPIPSITPKSSILNVEQPKLAPVLNVRCKSTTAQLYKTKYESGSKGKCILLGDEWLTPNEFEDRAGSKAKKYLSSIKCMGRPLRVYVNSGQLKGSGTPPATSKIKKTQTMKTGVSTIPVSIAPAPPPSPFGGSMHAPPTPQHISSAPPMPTNLGMMMASPHNATQIILNQTSSLMGSQQILTAPMTFTLAQPMEVRQSVTPAM